MGFWLVELLLAPPLIRICTHTFQNSKTTPTNTQKNHHAPSKTHIFKLCIAKNSFSHVLFFAYMILLKLKCQFHVAYNCCMLFFNTEFGIYLSSQSPGFKPNTVSQSPGFKPGTVSQSPGLNLALLSKAQALNLALAPFTYLIFKHKLSKISKKKISRQPTILSTKNYVTVILYPW